MNKNDILASYQWRFACKEFLSDKKIPDEDMDFLLEIIRLSPTSFGLQPFQVFVIRNKEILKELLSCVWGGQKQFPTASHVVMFATRKDIRYDEKHIAHMLNDVHKFPEDVQKIYHGLINKFQTTDFKLLDDERYLLDWAGKQAYIVLGNLMTAAAQVGIDSCGIEGWDKDAVTKILQSHQVIDQNLHEPLVFCALGYRVSNPDREKTRRNIDDLISFV